MFLKSWTTRGTGSDNVVMNFNNHRVTAHLQPDTGRGAAIQMIHGVIHCRNTRACQVPSEALTPPAEFAQQLATNAREFGFAPLFDAAVNNVPRAQADIDARAELAGMAFVYHAPEARYRVVVDGDQTWVTLDAGTPEAFQTYASKLGEGLFFVSWMGGVGGSHVVINTATAQVFDHILPDGSRRESIFKLDCFGPVATCP